MSREQVKFAEFAKHSPLFMGLLAVRKKLNMKGKRNMKYKGEEMETLQDLKAELKELEKRIDAKLEEEPERERGKNHWMPEYGKIYFYVSPTGDTNEDVWADHKVDFDRFKHIPIFKTEEEAEFEKERRKVEREIEDWASPFEVGERNYYFYYNHGFDEVGISYDVARQHTGLYFFSKEDADNCLQAVGEERVKKYYLGVE